MAVLETARILALLLAPVTPGVSRRMLQQLGLPGPENCSWADTAWGQLPAGHQTPAPAPVFVRIDDTVPYATEPAPGAAAAGGAAGGGEKGGKQQQKQQKQKQQKQKQPQEASA